MNGPGIIRPRQRQRSPAVPSYTIIAVGQRCVGKSSLLRLLLDTLPLSPHATLDQLRSVANFVSSPNSFCECHLEVLWHNERLLLHLIDTPPLTGDDTLAEIISVVEERYIRGAHSDSDEGDSALGESHVHLCLYLLDALQPDFHHDIATISRLSVRVNVLPILARSDVLTLNGLINFKQSIRARLADAGLGFGVFDKQGEAGVISTRHPATEPPRSLPLLPYAIFTPEHSSKLAYEPLLYSWMDKLDKRRVESQPSDTKMDVDRKIDEPSSSASSSSSSSPLSSSNPAVRHLTKPASSKPRDSSGSPPPASEQDPAHKSDHDAVTPANNNDTTTTNNNNSTLSSISALTDDKSHPRTPPISDPSALAQSSSPQSSALKDNFGTVRIKSDPSQQAPNAEDSAAAAHIEAEVQNADNSGRPKTAASSDRPLSSASSSSPQNGLLLHSDVKISPSINTIPLDPKTSTTPTPPTTAATATATATPEAPCFTEQKNHQNPKCNDAGFQNTVSGVSNDSELVMEKFVRVMRWGMLDCIDSRQSDFVRLRDEIMSWRKELKAYTHEHLYSRFKDDSFSRLAAQQVQHQQQHSHQRDPPPSSLEPPPPLSRRENIPRDAYGVSSPPPPQLPPSSSSSSSFQHGLRNRSTSFTDPAAAAERERSGVARPVAHIRDHDSYAYERDRDFPHRYPYHDRPRDKYLSPEREKDYHPPPPPPSHSHPHLSPHAATMPLSNERKHSISNGDRDRERSKYRDSIKHDREWEEQQQQQQRHHTVLPSIDRGDRYPRVSPVANVPPPPLPAPPPQHSHPGPYPPQYGSAEHFERERGREKISPSIREREMITPPLQRSGSSPGASAGTPISGMPTGQHGQVYSSNVSNPSISPTIASGGKQLLDVHSLLNHNNHHGVISQGMEKEWDHRERDRELSPNSTTMPSSGVPHGMPISNMPMSSGPQPGGIVGPAGSVNNVSGAVPNVGTNNIGRKRKITMACNFCRSRKLKCDGLKPACGQCTKRSNNCDYQQHAVAPQGPSGVPKDVPMNSQSRDHLSGQPNAIFPPTHVSGGQLPSPGMRHREREYGGREMERGRDGSYYHSERPYSPPGGPQPPLPPPSQQQGPGQSHGHPYPQQGYSSSSNYSRMREGSPPPQHHAHGATHTWRYTSQSHAQAHAAATRDSDVDELIEDLSDHEERNSDMRSHGGMKPGGHREFTYSVYEQTNGSGGMNSSSANGRGRVSVDMLIVEALGEGGSSSNGPLEDDNNNHNGRTGGPASAIGANGGRNREGVKDSEKGQQHVSQPPNQAQPPSGQGGHYESGPWHGMSVGVIDVGTEGDKKKRLNRQSANYGSKAVACVHCRARKTRCDAARPACSNCSRRSLACSYNHTTPSQPRSKGKKAVAAAAANGPTSSNSSSNVNPNSGSVPAMTPNGVIDHDMNLQRGNIPPHPSRSPNHSRSPGQVGTPHPLPTGNWHHASQSRQNHSHPHPHPHPHPQSHSHSRSSHSSSHSPIRADDHRLPIEESAERERPLTRSPQPPIATLNVPERSRSRSSSSASLSTSLMENGTHPNNNGNNGNGISRSRSTSNFTGAKRKSPDVAVELMDTASIERGIIPDERSRERPDKRRKAWVENASGDAPHLSNQVRVQ